MLIELPFPNLILNPNNSSGKHWSAAYGAKQDAKRTAFFLAKQAVGNLSKADLGNLPKWDDEIIVVIRIVPPDGCRRDMDNIEAALKSSQDGIFSALGLDDGRIVDKRTVMIRINGVEGVVYYELTKKGESNVNHVSATL